MTASRADHVSALARYISEIRRLPLLTREEEQALAARIDRGCADARSELVESNLGFVVKVASEYRNLGVPFEDLINEGNIGLIQAAKRYDATQGTKFITYAIWWIRKTILKALEDHSHLVRVPTHQRKKVREIRRAEQRLRDKLGRQPTRQEISDRLERSLAMIDRTLQLHLYETSLDTSVGEDDTQRIADFVADDSLTSAERELIDRESGAIVVRALRHLTDQQRLVICLRAGVPGSKRTLQQIGQAMGISRERVRQIEMQARQRLRKLFATESTAPRPGDGPHPRKGEPGGSTESTRATGSASEIDSGSTARTASTTETDSETEST